MGVPENLTGAQRAARYRAAKRAQGLRLKQVWVPDLRNPAVREAIRRSATEINRRDRADGTLDYLDTLYDEVADTPPPGGPGDQPSP